MPRSRPPKAAGTYGMLDMARQPSRLGQIPPALDQSHRDIAALERGEARLVACYLRNPPGSGRRGPRQGGLELSASTVSWRPFFGLRRPARLLDISGITLVRPAGPSDQRFGVPGNLAALGFGGTAEIPWGGAATKAPNRCRKLFIRAAQARFH
jgi:hypothetical protein